MKGIKEKGHCSFPKTHRRLLKSNLKLILQQLIYRNNMKQATENCFIDVN